VRVLSIVLKNFASYENLDLQFTNQGLTLISGPTGAGKSTLCDAIPWVIWGATAKGGAVSDVLSWPGDEVTEGTCYLDKVIVTRSRGPKSKDNDLFFSWNTQKNPHKTIHQQIRGKDLLDTQKMINTAIGMDVDLYLAAAYYHEFSQTAQFFTTTAKNRRQICEQLVDLSLAKILQTNLKEKYTDIDKQRHKVYTNIDKLKSNIDLLMKWQVAENTKAEKWQLDHEKTLGFTIADYEEFEAKRKRTISKKCNSCGTMLEHPREVHDTSENPYLVKLASLEKEINPHNGAVKDFSADIESKRKEIVVNESDVAQLSLDIDDIEVMQKVVNDYRSITIQNTINSVEQTTNQLLTDYFEGEIRVGFEVADADKLDVSIYKDGNAANFTQLSKGQRCMLKLCFGVSVMQAVQNHHGINVNVAMFDEALDGLSDALKIKAVRMLESLTQESVFLVEHSGAVQALLNNKYHVELVSGHSEICRL
jgi:DNA repair exonuclease SbcCD ATPase subunit